MGLGFCVKTIGTLSEPMLPYILSHILEDVIEREIKTLSKTDYGHRYYYGTLYNSQFN